MSRAEIKSMDENKLKTEFEILDSKLKEYEEQKKKYDDNPKIYYRKIKQLERKMLKISKKSVVMGNLIIKRDKQTADFKPLESEISDDKGVKFRGRSDNVIECNPA